MNLLQQHHIVNHYPNAPKFTGRHVPIDEIAKATGKSAMYIREGIKQGILLIGYAIKNENSSQYSFYCPDKLVWEQLGYFNYDKERKDE